MKLPENLLCVMEKMTKMANKKFYVNKRVWTIINKK